MDLSILDSVTRAEEGVEFEIRHPKTGKGTGFFLTVKGVDSKAYKAAFKEVMAKATPKTTANDIKEACLIATTIGWRGAKEDGKTEDITFNGKPLTFSEASLKLVFAVDRTIVDQAVAFQEDRANFLPEASAN